MKIASKSKPSTTAIRLVPAITKPAAESILARGDSNAVVASVTPKPAGMKDVIVPMTEAIEKIEA